MSVMKKCLEKMTVPHFYISVAYIYVAVLVKICKYLVFVRTKTSFLCFPSINQCFIILWYEATNLRICYNVLFISFIKENLSKLKNKKYKYIYGFNQYESSNIRRFDQWCDFHSEQFFTTQVIILLWTQHFSPFMYKSHLIGGEAYYYTYTGHDSRLHATRNFRKTRKKPSNTFPDSGIEPETPLFGSRTSEHSTNETVLSWNVLFNK